MTGFTFSTGTRPPVSSESILGIAVHELGHCAGLNHSGIHSATMFPIASPFGTQVGLDPDDNPIQIELEETVNDFFLGFLGTYHVNKPDKMNHLILAAGPQVHFLNSVLQNPNIRWSARDYRLGLSAFVRYYRRIEMFGRTSLALSASFSHVMSVNSRTDQYETPTDGYSFFTVTAGLAFPF